MNYNIKPLVSQWFSQLHPFKAIIIIILQISWIRVDNTAPQKLSETAQRRPAEQWYYLYYILI